MTQVLLLFDVYTWGRLEVFFPIDLYFLSSTWSMIP